MPPTLRQRSRGPPTDHNYSFMEGLGYPQPCTTPPAAPSMEDIVPVAAVQASLDIPAPGTSQPMVTEAMPTGQGQKRRKRKRNMCYDFGIPRRKKRRYAKVQPTHPAEEDSSNLSHTMTDVTHAAAGVTHTVTSANHTIPSASVIHTVTGFPLDLRTKKDVPSDTVVPNPDVVDKKKITRRSRSERPRTFMCGTCGKNIQNSKKFELCGSEGEHHSNANRRHSDRLVIKNYKLPFADLPVECKLKIFSLLSPQERCLAARVCQDWLSLVRSPTLWSHVNISAVAEVLFLRLYQSVPAKCRQTEFSQHLVYSDFKHKLTLFLNTISSFKPCVKHLVFHLDIQNNVDGYLKLILDFVDGSRCSGLKSLTCDWTRTPQRPPLDKYCCVANKMKTVLRYHILRIGAFQKFLETLVKKCHSIQDLTLPFDWSARSVLLLCRLQNLQSLRLTSYLNLVQVTPPLMDLLLRNLPHLQHLEMSVCIPCYTSKTLYTLRHSAIRHLDLSGCKGFFLDSIDIPSLEQIAITRTPWRGALMDAEGPTMPCLYRLLCQGTPNLASFNKTQLQSYWLDFVYDELLYMLQKFCPCKEHWQNPALE